jgi:hypothetical protein
MSEATLAITDFTGTLLRSGDTGYDEARRVFNGLIDSKPALIARCTSTSDVAAAVRHARENNLTVSVYGGGHGVTGAAVAEGSLCVDLRGLKSVDVDPDSRTVRAGGGLTWGELDAATQEHGLAVTGGRVPSTGIAGLALGSGSGWIERKCGFTCDNLLAAEVVTADGNVVTASETDNADLFWGLRGGGGNFGIVTQFTFQLHEVGPMVWGGMLIYPPQRAAEVARAYRDFVLTAPDEVGSGLAFVTAPDAEFVPEPARGHPMVGIICCYLGRPEDGPTAYAPLLALEPAMVMADVMPYAAVQGLIEPGNQKGFMNYWTADFYDELPDEAIDTLVEIATQPVSAMTQIIVVPGGGAIARVDDDAMALGSRQAAFNLHFLGMWADPAETQRNIDYIRNLAGSLKPWSTGAAYLNFLGDEGISRIEASFGPAKFARLQELKSKWDPTNLFRHNQNIPPAPNIPAPR